MILQAACMSGTFEILNRMLKFVAHLLCFLIDEIVDSIPTLALQTQSHTAKALWWLGGLKKEAHFNGVPPIALGTLLQSTGCSMFKTQDSSQHGSLPHGSAQAKNLHGDTCTFALRILLGCKPP